MRRHTLSGGGGLLSVGVVWSQAMLATGGGQGHHQHSAFASAPTGPSGPAQGVGVRVVDGVGGAVKRIGTGGPGASRHQTVAGRRNSAVAHGEDAVGGGAGGGRDRSQLIFVGTGSSTAVPSAFLLLHPELDTPKSHIAQLSVKTPPEVNKNFRGNTSVVVRIARKEGSSDSGGVEGRGGGRRDGEVPMARHVQIDTGKTWREGVIRWFPRHGVKKLDGIILTHDHADAMLGLDDVRSIQDSKRRSMPTPVHVSERTDRAVRRVFPYLVGRPEDNGNGGRFVAALKFNVFKDFQPFEVGGLEVTPFPVLHGEDYVSHGFLFGPPGNKICYISDVSRVPPESMEFLQRQGPIQLLVCDALDRFKKHPTHFSVEDSIQLANQLKARRTFLVGLGSGIEYHETNAFLASLETEEVGAPHVRLAYDGLAVDVDL